MDNGVDLGYLTIELFVNFSSVCCSAVSVVGGRFHGRKDERERESRMTDAETAAARGWGWVGKAFYRGKTAAGLPLCFLSASWAASLPLPFAYDHTTLRARHPVRSGKLSNAGPP
jgi:hypothetical protein